MTAKEPTTHAELLERGASLFDAYDEAERHRTDEVDPQMSCLKSLITATKGTTPPSVLEVAAQADRVKTAMQARVEKLLQVQSVAAKDMEAALYIFTQEGLDMVARSLQAARTVCDATEGDLLTIS